MDPFILQSIEHDIPFLIDQLQEMSFQMLSLQVTKYPIFVMHKAEFIPLGRPLLSAEAMHTDWNVSVSHLENLYHEKIILKESIDDFRQHYKDPKEYVCILVMTEEESGFIFHPYQPTIVD
jgi:hypothetical protein